MLTVMSSRASKGKDQLRLGDFKVAGVLKRSDDTCSRHVDIVKGVHNQRVCF